MFTATGCVSRGDAVFEHAQIRTVQIDNVPLVVQEDNQCAAASLFMVSQALSAPITHDRWKSLVFSAGRKGALPSDMLTAPRRLGLQAFPLDSPRQLPQALQAGYPVIVLLNLRFSWWPQWHYAVVTGYDQTQQEVTLHTGRKTPEEWPMPLFTRLWERSGNWGLAVSKANRLPAFVTAEQAMVSAIGLEKAEQYKAAFIAYHKLAKRFPRQCAAYIGMGNTAYRANEMIMAEKAWQKAARYPDCAGAANTNLSEIEN